MAEPQVGLSRLELEREVRWLLRKQPADPAKQVEFVADLVVDLLAANNRAIASHLARGTDALDAPEEF